MCRRFRKNSKSPHLLVLKIRLGVWHVMTNSVHKSRDDNLCKRDAQEDIYLKLLIKSNPAVFLLIAKG